jgi:hypothetical protein
MQLFCDEAGFTGNQLLDSEQEIFSYAAVHIDPDEALDLVQRIRRDFRVQAAELKASNLLPHTRGRKAITEILTRCNENYRVVVHLKPYALACKFFEYIFEPAVSNFNSFLYQIDFHRYIGTLLFVYFRARDKSGEQLLEDFTRFVRERDVSTLEAIFPKLVTVKPYDDPLQAIGTFALLHQDAIKAEILSVREPGVPNWILDLSTTSLYHLLAWWGERLPVLEVTCDESKPIKGDIQAFNSMVGRAQKASVNFQGKVHPLTFNLKSPLLLASSRDHSGLQIADVIASATAYAWRKAYRGIADEQADVWRARISEHLLDHSIWPDFDHLDLDQPGCFANAIVLQELVSRSVRGEDLFAGLPRIVIGARALHPSYMAHTRDIAGPDSAYIAP